MVVNRGWWPAISNNMGDPPVSKTPQVSTTGGDLPSKMFFWIHLDLPMNIRWLHVATEGDVSFDAHGVPTVLPSGLIKMIDEQIRPTPWYVSGPVTTQRNNVILCRNTFNFGGTKPYVAVAQNCCDGCLHWMFSPEKLNLWQQGFSTCTASSWHKLSHRKKRFYTLIERSPLKNTMRKSRRFRRVGHKGDSQIGTTLPTRETCATWGPLGTLDIHAHIRCIHSFPFCCFFEIIDERSGYKHL